MFKPTILYIKTHNITGLKYFGKTTCKDPHRYKGSGKYWLRHIKKHGYDVITEVIGLFLNEEECSDVAKKISQDFDIVSSDKWANFKIENGLDGGFNHLNDGSENHIKRCSEAGKKCHEMYPTLAYENLKHSHNSASAIKGKQTKIEKYGENYFSKIASKPKSEEHRKKLSEIAKKNNFGLGNLGKTRLKVKCPHCGKEGAMNTMSRFHFEKCKLLPGGSAATASVSKTDD